MSKFVSFCKRTRNILYRIGLVLGLILLSYQIVSSVAILVHEKLFQVNWLFVLVAFICSLLVPLLLMVTWKILLLGWKIDIGLIKLIEGFSLSFLPRYLPGTVWGYLSRNEWLLKEHGVRYETSNLINILEVFVGIVSGLLVSSIYGAIHDLRWNNLIIGGLVILSLALITCFINVSLDFFGIKASKLIMKSISAFHGWILGTLVYIFQWAVFGLVLFFIMKSLVSINLRIETALPVLAMDYFIGWFFGFIIVFIPSGFGIREYVLSGLLINQFSIISAQAYVVSVLARLLLTFSELAWVIIGLWLSRRKKDNTNVLLMLKKKQL